MVGKTSGCTQTTTDILHNTKVFTAQCTHDVNGSYQQISECGLRTSGSRISKIPELLEHPNFKKTVEHPNFKNDIKAHWAEITRE